MRNLRRNVLSAVMGLSFATAAVAGEAKFLFEVALLNYDQATTKSKVEDADELTTKTTAMSTVNLEEAYLQATFADKVQLYVNPFMALDYFRIGYLVLENAEVGIDLGLNSEKNKADDLETESKNDIMGLYGIYYASAGPGTVEGYFSYDMTKESAKNEAEEETKESGSVITLGANYVYDIDKNFQYVGGLRYAMYSTKATDKDDNETTNKSTVLDLKLLAFRYLF